MALQLPSFWMNKITSLTLLDKGVLGSFCLYKSYIFLLEYKYYRTLRVFPEEEIQIFVDYLNIFIRDINTPISIDLLKKKYIQIKEICNLGREVSKNPKFAKRLQNEQFLNSFLGAFRVIDERLKNVSLQLLPDHIPLYKFGEGPTPSDFPDEIKTLSLIRVFMTMYFHIFTGYIVPDTVLENIVSIAVNENNTYGCRKTMFSLLEELSMTKENCMNIVLSHGFTIGKFYEIKNIERKNRWERVMINRVMDAIKYQSFFLPKIIYTKLSDQEIQLLKSEISQTRLKNIALDLLPSVAAFAFTLFKTKNLLIAGGSTLLLSVSKFIAPSSNILEFAILIGGSLYIPSYVLSYVVKSIASIPSMFTKFVNNRFSEDPDQLYGDKYSDSELNNMIPSAEAIVDNNERSL